MEAFRITGGTRLAGAVRSRLPGDARAVELRATLMQGDVPLSETWIYRWTA